MQIHKFMVQYYWIYVCFKVERTLKTVVKLLLFKLNGVILQASALQLKNAFFLGKDQDSNVRTCSVVFVLCFYLYFTFSRE